MSFIRNVIASYGDSASLDSFSRVRVSNPQGLFDAQMTYNLAPLQYAQITNGSGATVAHDTTNRMALMTFASTPTGGKAYMQSYEYIPYQPGKSQLVFITFDMNGGVANVVKFAGYSDGTNGIEFQLSGTQAQVQIISPTSNGNETAIQSAWNLDVMDGTGPSGKTLNFNNSQILVIDFQALYVGRVRVGFDIDGVVYYVHQFIHSNIINGPYIQTANLPIRCGMTCTGTVSTTMNFICSSVISEGGIDELRGRSFGIEGTATAGSGTRTHILSVRPKTTFNTFTNRTKFELDNINILVTGTSPIFWEICLGQAISGTTTFNDVNTTYSSIEYNTVGLINGSPTLVISNGYCGAGTSMSVSVEKDITGTGTRFPLTLDYAGVVRIMGTLSLLVTGIGATSACRATFNWREIR